MRVCDNHKCVMRERVHTCVRARVQFIHTCTHAHAYSLIYKCILHVHIPKPTRPFTYAHNTIIAWSSEWQHGQRYVQDTRRVYRKHNAHTHTHTHAHTRTHTHTHTHTNKPENKTLRASLKKGHTGNKFACVVHSKFAPQRPTHERQDLIVVCPPRIDPRKLHILTNSLSEVHGHVAAPHIVIQTLDLSHVANSFRVHFHEQ